MKVKVQDISRPFSTVGNGWRLVWETVDSRRSETTILSGFVDTPHGYVDACSAEQQEKTTREWTRWSSVCFVYGGVVHSRHFDRAYTERGLVAKAKAFAAEVTAKVDRKSLSKCRNAIDQILDLAPCDGSGRSSMFRARQLALEVGR